VFALFAFIVYYNLLNLGQSWIGSGRTSFTGFMLALHGGVLLLALLWLAKQHNNWACAPAATSARRAAGSPRMKTLRRLIYGEVLVRSCSWRWASWRCSSSSTSSTSCATWARPA
jgi:hypothetical protein